MILVKKLKFFHVLCLSKIDQVKVLLTVYIKKKPLKTIKTTVYEKLKIRIFFKRVSASFWSKISDFFNFAFYEKWTKKKYLVTFWLEKTFYNPL